MKDIRSFLIRMRILPKWAIFILDLGICIFSFVIANLLLSNFDIVFINNQDLWHGIWVILISSAIFFSIFKTYDGIIRFSETREILRIVYALLLSVIVLLAFNVVFEIFLIKSFIPNSSLIVYFFIASFSISAYRLLIKNVYKSGYGIAREEVLIFGGAENAGLLRNTIETISETAYKVVAFLEDENRFIGKSVDNIRIMSYNSILSLLDSKPIQTLFIAKENPDPAIVNFLVEKCLEKKVKVKNIPPPKTWMHGHLSKEQIQEVKIEDLLGRPSIQLLNKHVIALLKGKRILITGAAGSIGSELAIQVAEMLPESLILCDQLETGLYSVEYEIQQKFHNKENLKIVLCDIKDRNAVEQIFLQHAPQIVFHAAAYKHVPIMESHPSEAIRNNVMGTMVLSNLSEYYGVERFLFVSTDKAINPSNIMGASKRIAEMYCHALHHGYSNFFESNYVSKIYHLDTTGANKIKFITTRFGNVLGSNGSVIPRFKQQIDNGGPVTVTHPEVIRYFMTIQEACSLVLEAITMGNGGEVFLFDMGEPVKISDLAEKMIRLAGHEPGKQIEIKYTGLRPGEKLYEELLNKAEEVLETHHKKILISKVQTQDYGLFASRLKELMLHAEKNDDAAVVKLMKQIVPEYKSNNSVYTMYDSTLPGENSLPSAL
ncbi:MAG: nucleoside-diphosphate sugar epimerase/dehydratase [Bacteroidota bacterium]